MSYNNRTRTSHTVIETPTLNPMHKAMVHLAEHQPFLAGFAALLHEKKIENPDWMVTASLPRMDLFQKDPEILKKMEGMAHLLMESSRKISPDYKPEVANTRPPPASEIYGRVQSDTKVLDVGTGKGKRLIGYKTKESLKVVTCDVEGIPKPEFSDEHQVGFDSPSEMPVVSFNSLTNNKDQSAFKNSDGVHVIPNLPQFSEYNNSQESVDEAGDPCYLTKDPKSEEVYKDYPLDDEIVSEPIVPFYNIANTYKERKIEIKVGDKVSQSAPFCSQGTRAVGSVMGTATYKYNGEIHEVKKKGTRCFVRRRNGEIRNASVGDCPDLHLYFEKLTTGECVLIKLLRYNGIRPYHSAEQLHNFCQRVKITIGGMPLVGPEEYSREEYYRYLAEGRVDGLVYRHKERDLLVKHDNSFDVKADNRQVFIDTVQDAGFYVQTEGIPKEWDGILEIKVEITYEYDENGNVSVATLVPMKPRDDKKAATTMPEVKRGLSFLTVREMHRANGDEEIVETGFDVDDEMPPRHDGASDSGLEE